MKKKNLTYLKMAFVFIFAIISFLLINNKSEESITRILAKEEYSYLPEEAKDYIKEVYEETGEVVLTEKNKKENTPYLNPKYADYLTLSDEEKENIEVEPNPYVVDFSSKLAGETETYPSTYNLKDVNGSNYLTPINDQGILDICWAVASIEQAESYLMVKNNQSYSPLTQRFSLRQMDYATSINGIKNYDNENGFRPLTTAGNYYMSSLLMSWGLSLTDYTEYNLSQNQKELVDVLNYKNSNYEVKTTINMPILTSRTSSTTKEAFINTLKDSIIKYGGAYLLTGNPEGDCGFQNTDGSYAIVERDYCRGYMGHAMQLIGWDDNYEYSYCKDGAVNVSTDSSVTCSYGTLATGKGAWILRNSWGEETDYKYVYLGYNSYDYEVNFITSLTSMDDRLWDNTYHKNFKKDGIVEKTSDTVIFNKKINTPEKLEEIKFISSSSSGRYKVTIETGDNIYENIKTEVISYPGIYTIDLSNQNIVLNDSNFKITISSTNNSYLSTNTISAFTSNIDKSPLIKTKNINANDIKINKDENYELIVYSSTKNIDSNEQVTYSLYKNETDYSSNIISYNNNLVAENNVNATLTLNKDIQAGNYKLRVYYNDYYAESDIQIPSQSNLQGSGTMKDPYLIYNEDDLNQIKLNLNAYYLLQNDITLTNDWVPIGTSLKPFRGGLDGGGYTINGLTIAENSEDSVGLFGYIEAKFKYSVGGRPVLDDYGRESYIKNLKIKNAQITNTGNASALIGQLTFNTNNVPSNTTFVDDQIFTIDNVHFIDGSVSSTDNDAGVIIGRINIIPRDNSIPTLNINNTYSSLTYGGKTSAGLIGYINDSFYSENYIAPQITMSNFQNVGLIDVSSNNVYKSDNKYSTVVGGLYGNIKLELNNYIINSVFNNAKYISDYYGNGKRYFIGNYDTSSSDLNSTISNGYYVSKYKGTFYKVPHTSSKDLKDSDLYTSWTDFDEYWKIENIDGITRIPVLKAVEYNYTSASDISIKRNEEVSLLDYINGKSDVEYINYNVISNNNIISIKLTDDKEDIIITALNKGTATIHIINEYDGYEKDIDINVTMEKPVITYNYNVEGSEEKYTQEVNYLESFTLTKNTFKRDWYIFKGWNTMPDGSGTSYADEIAFESGIDKNINLYAQWESKKYTFKFNANGGVGSMSDTLVDTKNTITLPNNQFTKANYKFIGWNTESDKTGLTFTNGEEITLEKLALIKGNIVTLYAIWEKEKYTITFNANGGLGSMSNQTFTLNTSQKIAKNTFTKEGYRFIGWNTKSDGTGVSYTDEKVITLNQNLTLYAIWEQSYTYKINNYTLDENKKYIDRIDINTTLTEFKKNIDLNTGYTIDVNYKTINNTQVLYTGSKTKIYNNNNLIIEYTNIIRGETNGDGKINYLDYVNVYNHIQKVKHPESTKKELINEYLVSADMSLDGKVNYLDYVKIYNKIKELKGGSN